MSFVVVADCVLAAVVAAGDAFAAAADGVGGVAGALLVVVDVVVAVVALVALTAADAGADVCSLPIASSSESIILPVVLRGHVCAAWHATFN